MDYKRKMRELIAKSEITDVVNAYFRAFGEKHFDAEYFSHVFVSSAQVTRPNGSPMIGTENISASHENSFTRFEGSKHLLTGRNVLIDGDSATVRTNLVAMDVWNGSRTNANAKDNFFIAGGVIRAELTLEGGQWKLSELSNIVV